MTPMFDIGHHSPASLCALLTDMGVLDEVTAKQIGNMCAKQDPEDHSSDLRILLAIQSHVRRTVHNSQIDTMPSY
jgi:hypothetical protein